MRARDNPFAVQRVLRLRYQFREGSWPSLLSRLKSLGHRAAIVGPHGSGKTTLLEELGERLSVQGGLGRETGPNSVRVQRLFLNQQDRAYPAEFVRRVQDSCTANDIILFDGCEQLGPIAWRRFCWQTRRVGGLVLTTHRPGRLPTLWSCETNLELLSDLVGQLLDQPSAISTEQLRQLHEKHAGNLREAIRELYDLAAHDSSHGPRPLPLGR